MKASASSGLADPASVAEGVRGGQRAALARLLSWIEAGEESARPVLAALAADTGRAYTVGVTGAPGAGKSSLIDRLVGVARERGESIAVLAIDPSSPRSGGAILGDRVRMTAHATDPGVFIRSMATRGQLGGLAAAVPQAVRALDASGFPWIVVETVGVGQVEIDIAGAADTTVVVVNPGWGDGVQANKAGLLEVADVFVVNKADRAGADAAVKDLVSMLHLGAATAWTPPIVETVATEDKGLAELWEAIRAHREHLVESGALAARRRERLREELRAAVQARFDRLAEECCRGSHFEAGLDRAQEAGDPGVVAEQLVAEALGQAVSARGQESD